MSDLAVIKLGGSYASSAQLRPWLEAIEACAGNVVLVPGGGPFADAVRNAQFEMRFDDRTAHRMALLAMEQYGLAIASAGSRFKLAASVEAIRGVLAEGGVPVWSPLPMVAAAKELPASWEVTSDSLAAWLTGMLGLKRLLLVKRIPSVDLVSARALAARGIVDPLFPRFLGPSGATAYLAGSHDVGGAAAQLSTGRMPGRRISLP